MRLSIALSVVLFGAVALALNPSPPMIPPQWQSTYVQIQVNAQGQVTTLGGRQYSDYTANAQRLDMAFSGGMQSAVILYSEQALYAVQVGAWSSNVPSCVKQPQTNTMIPQNVFQNATYGGRVIKNDQLTDVWWVLLWGPQYDTNLTVWWAVENNAPVASLEEQTDGMLMSEIAYLDFVPAINFPSGWELFGVPAMCPAVDEVEQSEMPLPMPMPMGGLCA